MWGMENRSSLSTLVLYNLEAFDSIAHIVTPSIRSQSWQLSRSITFSERQSRMTLSTPYFLWLVQIVWKLSASAMLWMFNEHRSKMTLFNPYFWWIVPNSCTCLLLPSVMPWIFNELRLDRWIYQFHLFYELCRKKYAPIHLSMSSTQLQWIQILCGVTFLQVSCEPLVRSMRGLQRWIQNWKIDNFNFLHLMTFSWVCKVLYEYGKRFQRYLHESNSTEYLDSL